LAREHGAAGATDITGFGLLGHGAEMVAASGAGLSLTASRVPLLPGALTLAEAGHFSGGMKRNRRHVDHVLGARLQIDPAVPATLVSILSEAETSGGLLFSVAAERASAVLAAFKAAGEPGWEIGEVVDEPVISIAA
jgi:selenide, water dikinase